MTVEPDIDFYSNDHNYSCHFQANFKRTNISKSSDYDAVKEGYCDYFTQDFLLLFGFNTEFWGVAESHNTVNILNQVNLKEGFDSDERLGVFMIKGTYNLNLGEFSYYYLPKPDRVDYPDNDIRWSYIPDGINILPAVYDNNADKNSGIHILRYRGNIEAWEYALYLYHGLSRDAVLKPTSTEFSVRPHYYIMTQYALEAQYTGDGLLLKLESFHQSHNDDRFISIIAGLEA
jgi:hypothetical protein